MEMEPENIPPLQRQLDGKTVAAPSSGRLAPTRGTKSVKESSAAGGGGEMLVDRRPMAELKMVVAGTAAWSKAASGAGSKAAASGSGVASAGVAKAKPAGARRTKVVDVQQGYIDCLLNRPPRRPYPAMSDEAIDMLFRPEDREGYRRLQSEAMAIIKRMQDEDDRILHQWRTEGRATQEVSDNDDDED